LRALSWSRRGAGRQRADDWEGVDAGSGSDTDSGSDTGSDTDSGSDTDRATARPDAEEWADDFHDPDPWGEAEPVATVATPPAPRRPGTRSGTSARPSGRKSRLPKMAEWRNGTDPRP
jgi:clumping factor A